MQVKALASKEEVIYEHDPENPPSGLGIWSGCPPGEEDPGQTQDTQDRLHLQAGLGAPWLPVIRRSGPCLEVEKRKLMDLWSRENCAVVGWIRESIRANGMSRRNKKHQVPVNDLNAFKTLQTEVLWFLGLFVSKYAGYKVWNLNVPLNIPLEDHQVGEKDAFMCSREKWDLWSFLPASGTSAYPSCSPYV